MNYTFLMFYITLVKSYNIPCIIQLFQNLHKMSSAKRPLQNVNGYYFIVYALLKINLS